MGRREVLAGALELGLLERHQPAVGGFFGGGEHERGTQPSWPVLPRSAGRAPRDTRRRFDSLRMPVRMRADAGAGDAARVAQAVTTATPTARTRSRADRNEWVMAQFVVFFAFKCRSKKSAPR